VIMHRMWCDGTEFRWTKETVRLLLNQSAGWNTASPEQESDPKFRQLAEGLSLAGRWTR